MTEEARRRIRELKKEEQQLVNSGPFSQDDADRQSRINEKIRELSQREGVNPDEVTVQTNQDTEQTTSNTSNTSNRETTNNEENRGNTGGEETLSRDEVLDRIEQLEQQESQLAEKDNFSQDDVRKQNYLNLQIESYKQALDENPRIVRSKAPDEETGIGVTAREEDALDQFQERVEENTPYDASDVAVNRTEEGVKFSIEEAAIESRKDRKQAEQFFEEQRQEDVSSERIDSVPDFVDKVRSDPTEITREDLITGGVSIMQRGQEVGEAGSEIVNQDTLVRETSELSSRFASNLGLGTAQERQGFERQFQDTFSGTNLRPSTTLERRIAGISEGSEAVKSGFESSEVLDFAATQSQFTQTQSELDARQDLATGIGTGGSQLIGLGVATTGAVPRALEEDTPSIQEGVATGAELTAEEVTSSPAEFTGQEIGEEVGEGIIGTAVLGPAGIGLAATPTPEFTPEVNPDISGTASKTIQGVRDRASSTFQTVRQRARNTEGFSLTNTRKGTVTTGSDTNAVPDFVTQFESESPGFNTETEEVLMPDTPDQTAGIETETTTSTETESSAAPVRPQNVTGPTAQSDILSEAPTLDQSTPAIETETETITRSDAFADIRAEFTSRPEALADVRTESRAEPEINVEPESELTPRIGFGGGSDRTPDSESIIAEPDVGSGIEGGFAASVSGIFSGETLTEEEAEEELEQGLTGFETRGLVVDENNDNNGNGGIEDIL